MKRIVVLSTLFVLLLSSNTYAQAPDAAKDTVAPYLKHPKLPNFQLLLMDSTTILNSKTIASGKPILIFYFGPDCDHCQKLMQSMISGFDSLKNIRIYMVTFERNVSKMKKFYERFNLDKFSNVQIGKDENFFLADFYRFKSVPYLVLYDANKIYVNKWEGHATVQEVYEAAKSGGTPARHPSRPSSHRRRR